MYQPSDAPRSIGGVLDDGFNIYRASLPQVAVLSFFGALAGQLPSLTMPVSQGTGSGIPELGPWFFFGLLVSIVASLLCYGAVIGRMDAVAQQRQMSIPDALSLALARAPALLGCGLIYMVSVVVGSLLLLIPGIILSLSLMLGVYLVLIDRQGPIEALKTSHRLVWGHWWRTAAILTVGMFVMIVAYLLASMLAGVAIAFLGSTEPEVAVRYVQLIMVPVMGILVTPLFYALVLAVYYDLKLRRSGADLETRIGATAGAAAHA